MEKITQALRVLGDETRLRIVNLISQVPLNVSELTSILGLAQSGVSRHLSHLKQLGLLYERKEGVWSYYKLTDPENLDTELQLLWNYLQEQLSALEDPFRDQVRLKEILRQREDRTSGLNERLLEPGQSWLTWSRALGFFLPNLDVADLGCGDGTITMEIARFARSVVGVEHNQKVLDMAKERAARMNLQHVTFKTDRIEELSLPNMSTDFVLFSQSLHHLPRPELGLQEASRILRPGGRMIIMELAPHQEEWVREKLGHMWMGFETDTLTQMMNDAGLQSIQIEANPPRWGESFRVILASGIKKTTGHKRL
ncbi:MAG: metalloregulator ArsR/SmtB family transcription factor [SAR324 cluster bacterium]|nr:metalloregulator ArsR/SmtB family transcription factor [SAR324 cluster bacterium]